jgi:omega-6 fatty acid desaturase (delta-12 desaturase)
MEEKQIEQNVECQSETVRGIRKMIINNSHNNKAENNNRRKKKPDWYYDTAKYAKPSPSKASFQLFDTFLPYVALWVIMIFTVLKHFPFWITLSLSLIAAAFLVRIFVLFHDCVHNSFFASRLANRICGYICGILTCTPYDEWQWTHSRHHASAADLDNRGYGSVWTMTVDEYLTATWALRLKYRLFRNPFILFGIAPCAKFLLLNRFASKGAGRRQKRSVIITNIATVIIFLAATIFLGFWNFFKIATPVMIVATTTGIWLFYIQHQFEGVYWMRHEKWDTLTASLKGCSYYKLPNILHWFTANIGIHHVHHLRTAIPNYNLQQCYDETPQLQDINALTIRQSLKSLRLNLWDEDAKELISFRSIT